MDGSTDVLYTSTWGGENFGNHTTERQSFDAWGERRAAATHVTYRAGDGDAFRTGGNDYDRGYTGHEQLDDSGLIHMNGRLYDPELGRMLSPDPFVQIPEFSQNFNRYSYVLNNPLNLTDPSGFDWLGNLGAKSLNWLGRRLGPTWSTVLVIVTRVVITHFAGPVWGSTAAAGLQAGLNGGSASDIRRAEAIGFAQGVAFQGVDAYTYGLTDSALVNGAIQTAGHAVVGGASNYAMGGKFSDGFYSAAVANELGGLAGSTGAYDNVITGTIASGVIGGTASVIGGGKFANGAWTAAFGYLAAHPPIARAGGSFNGKHYMRTSSGDLYLGDSAEEFVSNLQTINDRNQTISVLAIYGHGSEINITLGGGELIQSEYADGSRRYVVTDTGEYIIKDVTGMLKNANVQKAYFYGCNTAELAKSFSSFSRNYASGGLGPIISNVNFGNPDKLIVAPMKSYSKGADLHLFLKRTEIIEESFCLYHPHRAHRHHLFKKHGDPHGIDDSQWSHDHFLALCRWSVEVHLRHGRDPILQHLLGRCRHRLHHHQVFYRLCDRSHRPLDRGHRRHGGPHRFYENSRHSR
jgi:RHS repeat-associated protein